MIGVVGARGLGALAAVLLLVVCVHKRECRNLESHQCDIFGKTCEWRGKEAQVELGRDHPEGLEGGVRVSVCVCG
jgi:hypothetical protein